MVYGIIMGQDMEWVGIGEGWRKGPWTTEEDKLLVEHVNLHGEGKWNNVSRLAGLKRNGKSCRLRWVNYLRPDLKRGQITPHEESIILELHAIWGNRWSTIARSLPGRTDNEIKNYWRTHFKKKENNMQSPEKSKARLLRRQQFQQQQQRQKDQMDMKRFASLVDENDGDFPSLAQLRQEMARPITSYNSPMSGYYGDGVPEGSGGVDRWDGFWNVDDNSITNRGCYYQHSLASGF